MRTEGRNHYLHLTVIKTAKGKIRPSKIKVTSPLRFPALFQTCPKKSWPLKRQKSRPLYWTKISPRPTNLPHTPTSSSFSVSIGRNSAGSLLFWSISIRYLFPHSVCPSLTSFLTHSVRYTCNKIPHLQVSWNESRLFVSTLPSVRLDLFYSQ